MKNGVPAYHFHRLVGGAHLEFDIHRGGNTSVDLHLGNQAGLKSGLAHGDFVFRGRH